MRGKLWTDTEIGYFRQGLSDWEIMQKTGRTAAAVLKKRSKVTDNTEGVEQYVIPPCMLMSQEEKENRIHQLAEQYGVKLMG